MTRRTVAAAIDEVITGAISMIVKTAEDAKEACDVADAAQLTELDRERIRGIRQRADILLRQYRPEPDKVQ